MADQDQNHNSQTPESRPSTSHRVDDRPSWDHDRDPTKFSPLREKFDDNRPRPTPASATTSSGTSAPTPPTVLKLENIPPLHHPSTENVENSFDDGPSLELRHSDSQAEIAVRQHLQDIESSFTATLSPVAASNNGIDDTFLFDSPSKRPLPRASPRPIFDADDTVDESLQTLPAQRTPPRPAHVADESELSEAQEVQDVADTSHAISSNSTSMLEAFSSSPTAAATARTISRAVSQASRARTGSGDESADMTGHHLQDHDASSQSPYKHSLDAGSTPGQSLKGKDRPKYLRSRMASQRSSVSSLITNPESDVTVGLGVDYALQSGGSVPPPPMQRSTSNILSRSVSMGSMASGIDDLQDVTGPIPNFSGSSSNNQLETLDEMSPNPKYGAGRSRNEDDMLQTPKARRNNPSLTAPTDTVIARHVRDVQVPESLAREYKTKSGLVTPARRPPDFNSIGSSLGASTATSTNRNGRSLTLKEQSSTIERLSKENFDLKLKVMFLSDRLDKLSEEGIKEMISENVELKTGLAVLQRDNKVLRRRVKELEKQIKDDDVHNRPGTARSFQSDDEQTSFDQEAAQEREEEILYLREQMEEYVVEIDRLRNENMHKEADKRRMAEVVRNLGERAGERFGESMDRQEEADVWKDLLEQETARREQGDDDNRRLREEVFRLKQELSAHTVGGALHHTTNIYNITKKHPRSTSPSRPMTSFSGADMDANGTLSAGSTLVEDLRRESEQLRHENAELRREVGAQTSMLTSRNREKERLYQEIEDLKMAQRRGGPAPSTIDSILERSASRAGVAHERSQSRISGGTRVTEAVQEDPDREELENKLAEFRDKNNGLKLQNQDLQRELDACMADFETAVDGKKQAEELVAALQEDLDTAMNDLMALQAERDEALQEHANLDNEFEALRKEAQEEIDALEGDVDQRNTEIDRLQLELNDGNDNFNALQEEMRKLSDAIIGLEDEQENKARRIQQLEQELGDANKELEDLEQKLLESNDKAQRLSVQQESSQGEIAFLREEQEADKIRIGHLEAALANVEQSLREERDRARELEQRLAAERRQREIVANREKEEVQQFVNELNREASTAKDEVRRLRKNLTTREVEATEWKERLIELENNLREALGDLNGTRSSLLKSIAKLQRDLENTVRDLDTTKASLMEKDRIIKQRDALLESHSLEYNKLADLLEKEKQAHRNSKHQFETFQKTHNHVTRTVSSQDARIMELETTRQQDKKRLSQLENNFKDQLTERNNLLLVLWTRLSGLCGTDWAHDNSLINGRALPSLEAVTTMLPGFSKNLLAAVKTIETMVGSFQGKIKSVEKDLWREYQTLESHLDMRTKKLDRLEAIVRNGIATGQLGGVSNSGEAQSRLAKLEEAYRALRVENHTLRTAAEVRARAAHAYAVEQREENLSSAGSPLVPTGPGKSRETRGMLTPGSSRIPKSGSGSQNGIVGGESASTRDRGSTATANNTNSNSGGGGGGGGGGERMDNKWMLRLRDLEYKLKAEREGRILDRGEAMKRINASEGENLTLRENLERERRRNHQQQHQQQQQGGRPS
ncbi:hypothetical protein B0T17DRAFT_610727 [Bombardia bombarda]|uniref:Anucleate primary sterigmata protein B n=1 Tax=Bombardia bombarda TaxID=252184 RepID=A0AA39W9T3_9PEZI|nr:hypothetical protein B0T17DRAFT_610727 [Bombardia bombarda]